ncbi:nucleotidyltransferase domain-containing protein [Staphylococcus epidermidis]
MEFYKTFNRIYVFGSYLTDKKNSNDIDIVIIYKYYSSDFRKDLYKFKKKLSNLVNLPLDITALSEKEEKDVNFIDELNNNYIVLK